MTANELVPAPSAVPAVVLPPDYIQIGPVRVKVTIEEGVKTEDGNPAFGEWMSKNNTIRLEADQSLATRQHTLVHECMHAMFWLGGASALVGAMAAGEIHYRANWEEMLVAAMDGSLLVLMRDNPELVEYLRAR